MKAHTVTIYPAERPALACLLQHVDNLIGRPHPPYYVLAGVSEAAIQSLSAVAGSLTPAELVEFLDPPSDEWCQALARRTPELGLLVEFLRHQFGCLVRQQVAWTN